MTNKAVTDMKRVRRKAVNRAVKELRQKARQRELVQLGQTLKAVESARVSGENDRMIDMTIEKIVDNGGVLPEPARPSINKLTWLNGKQYAQAFGARKNRPGEHLLHAAAIVEDASRAFAKEVDKATTPLAETPLGSAVIGEFADHDQQQGDAIDNSIATGEGLFA
jgi:hypothetical protein